MAKKVRKQPRNVKGAPRSLGGMQVAGDHDFIAEAFDIYKPGSDYFRIIEGTGRKKHVVWAAPDDMLKWQAILVHQGRMCGAIIPRYIDPNGTVVMQTLSSAREEGLPTEMCKQLYCRRRPIIGSEKLRPNPPYRCYAHCANADSLSDEAWSKHNRASFYAQALPPEDALVFAEIVDEDHFDIDYEIALAKILLRGHVRNKSLVVKLILEDRADEALMIASKEVRDMCSAEKGESHSSTVKRVMIDWDKKINEALNQVVRLIELRHRLRGGDGELDSNGVAERIRASIDSFGAIHRLAAELN